MAPFSPSLCRSFSPLHLSLSIHPSVSSIAFFLYLLSQSLRPSLLIYLPLFLSLSIFFTLSLSFTPFLSYHLCLSVSLCPPLAFSLLSLFSPFRSLTMSLFLPLYIFHRLSIYLSLYLSPLPLSPSPCLSLSLSPSLSLSC